MGPIGPQAIPERVPSEIGVSAMVSVDIFPGLGIDEGELVRRVANHRTVLIVQFFQLVNGGTAAEGARAGDVGDNP